MEEKAKIGIKALTAMADEFVRAIGGAVNREEALKFLKANPDVVEKVSLISNLPAGRFVKSRLSELSPVGQEMSDFVATLVRNPRTLAKKDFPKVARDLGLQPVEGYAYGSRGKFRDPSKKALNAMRSNVEAMATGDPNFYWDGNRLILASAPDIDPKTAILSFAPFSGSTAVRENLRTWQRFVENPLLFPGRVNPEGGLTTGNAWADALRILGLDDPTPANLSVSGDIVKVGSFGDNLLDPASSMRATVDRHSSKNALGLYLPDSVKIDGKTVDVGPTLGDPRTYAALERPFIDAAQAAGRLPHEVQSASWDTWRRIMQANPDASMLDPSEFVVLRQSPILDLSPQERRGVFKDVLTDLYGKDEKWLKRAGLL